MYYYENRKRARTENNDPTETDQSQANDADINVIVGRYGIGNVASGNNQQGMSGDFTALPEDLRGFIEMGRNMENLRETLPPQLRDRTTEDILALTPEQLTNILTPEPPPPAASAENKETK